MGATWRVKLISLLGLISVAKRKIRRRENTVWGHLIPGQSKRQALKIFSTPCSGYRYNYEAWAQGLFNCLSQRYLLVKRTNQKISDSFSRRVVRRRLVMQKILVIEDTPDVRDLITDTLKFNGF